MNRAEKGILLAIFSWLIINAGGATAFAQEVKTDTIDGVIVPQEEAGRYFSGNKVQGYFTPSKEDVLVAESRIIDYIEDHTPQALGSLYSPDVDQKLANYKRQYVGVILDGRKKIWMNFFCYTLNTDWKHNPYVVFGGGGCYFNVLYDIEKKEFSHLTINGLSVETRTGSREHEKKTDEKEQEGRLPGM